MNKQKQEENPAQGENLTVKSCGDSEGSDLEEEFEDTEAESDNYCGFDGVIGDNNTPFRFIFGEEARARSLKGIAYGLDENGEYFVVGDDGGTMSGLLVDGLIKRNIEDGILPSIGTCTKTIADKSTVQSDVV